jgi:hypothetical protein
MEAMSSAPGCDNGDKHDGILRTVAVFIRPLLAIIRGLSGPRGSHPSQIVSQEMLERFELMLRCGF